MYVYTMDIYWQIGLELISKECGVSFTRNFVLYYILPSVGQATLWSVNDLHICRLVRSQIDESQLNRSQGRVHKKWSRIKALENILFGVCVCVCVDFKSFTISWLVFNNFILV